MWTKSVFKCTEEHGIEDELKFVCVHACVCVCAPIHVMLKWENSLQMTPCPLQNSSCWNYTKELNQIVLLLYLTFILLNAVKKERKKNNVGRGIGEMKKITADWTEQWSTGSCYRAAGWYRGASVLFGVDKKKVQKGHSVAAMLHNLFVGEKRVSDNGVLYFSHTEGRSLSQHAPWRLAGTDYHNYSHILTSERDKAFLLWSNATTTDPTV